MNAQPLDSALFQGKSVFVTGHTGFKGTWLSHWLHQLGAQVHGYSLAPPSSPSLYDSAGTEALCTSSSHGDVLDLAQLQAKLLETQPQLVFHLAAQSLVRKSYRQPVDTFATNVMGTLHLLEAARHCPSVRAVVVVTSDKCYENHEHNRPFVESDALGGHDPYSASKGAAEIVVQSYQRSFFAQGDCLIASARAGNVIGGGDFAEDRLLPDLVRAFSRSEPVHIRSPHATRPFQHVLEPLYGYLLLAARLYAGDRSCARAFNFGPLQDDVCSVGQLTQRACELWGNGASCRYVEQDNLKEARLLNLDIHEAMRVLGYRPTWDLERGLRQTLHFYRALNSGSSAGILIQSEVAEFMRDSGNLFV